MLIESYALNTAWNIGLMISLALKKAAGANFFNYSITQVDVSHSPNHISLKSPNLIRCLSFKVLVYFLLVYRVYSGRGWDRQTHGHLSTLRWAGTQSADATTATTVNMRTVTGRESLEGPPPHCQLDSDAEISPTSK
jgi:hypothetical protein